MTQKFLFKPIDNTPLLVFRVFFGILVALECYGAILTGWVRRTLVAPQFTFTFIGFEWLGPLAGPQMYVYFVVMGTLGVCIALGYRYKTTALLFAMMWTGVYLLQKTSYNNHYYLLVLLSFMMALVPAHHGLSLDAKRNPAMNKPQMFALYKWLIVGQVCIVFTYGAIAKMYPDWLDLTFIKILMQGKKNLPIIGAWLQFPWAHKIMCWYGILFDLLVIPALLWKPTRKIAFISAVFFHLFNSIVFQVGIFPYLSLAFSLFFFEPQNVRKLFAKNRKAYAPIAVAPPKKARLIMGMVGLYFLIQIGLPLRHHYWPGDVLWTEEGHRMSWRMMLRSKYGSTQFRVFDNNTQEALTHKPLDHLTQKQWRRVKTYPDFMWQYAHYLKKYYAEQGLDVAVYADSKLSVNGRLAKPYIDPYTDLTAVPWKHLAHNDWILDEEKSTAASKPNGKH
jgi:hypothetical protein